MNKQIKNLQIYFINAVILLGIIGLSGCTSYQNGDKNTDETLNAFLGTWVGSLQMSVFGAGDNVMISQIAFRSNRSEMLLTNGNRTFRMNYTYSVTSDTIVLTPILNNRNGLGRRDPFNGTLPPNGTKFPGNWTLPPNGTQPPGNRTWPPNGTFPNNNSWPLNGTQPPRNNQLPMTLSLRYYFNEEKTVLTLNAMQYTKL